MRQSLHRIGAGPEAFFGSKLILERVMKNLSIALIVPLAFLFGACSSSAVVPTSASHFAEPVAVSLSPEIPRDTVLLVSRNDGSVVMQTIRTSADVCFKKSSDSATTCLTQGEPLFDPVSNAVIGFEMIEEHIDLVASTN